MLAYKCKHLVSATTFTSDPTPFDVDFSDDDTVSASNVSTILPRRHAHICAATPAPVNHVVSAVTISRDRAIADTGATSIFIMDGVDVDNKRIALKPLTVNLPDGRMVQSSHVCDIMIPGLPTVLTGHIVPSLSVASLIGIRPLCKAGCKVVFDDLKCDVIYNNTIILRGLKDPSTDLWTLPIGRPVQPLPSIPGASTSVSHKHVATFTHSVRTRVNAVKFAHQSLCSPKISTLLKAVRRGFLTGCPNMTEHLILKYLNPSTATAKGHMKRPRHGIRSTRKGLSRVPMPSHHPLVTIPVIPPPRHALLPAAPPDTTAQSIANIFCFGAFADRQSGIVYHDLTGSFPFMSFDGSVCFFVLYHYESNAILATPIAGLDDVSVFKAYKDYFRFLSEKGFKPKLNIMDNQATKHIKHFLTENDCRLQVVEPHNHRVNAAERAIQTFKAAFIAALATTDSDFPLQLWDRLTPQVETTLNLLRASRLDPTKSAYEILHGPYDWNRYPMAPLGCKAVVYEDGDTRGSWASRGVDAFYLGPAKDHYRCDIYYIPETRAYRISGSTELFPQHCQLPALTQAQHFRALTDELAETATVAGATPDGRRLLTQLGTRINDMLHLPPVSPEQRVTVRQPPDHAFDQRLIADASPVTTLPRLTTAPPILLTRNPTAKRSLHTTPRLHRRVTRNNIPGIASDARAIVPPPIIPTHPNQPCPHRQRRVPSTPTRVQPH